MNSNEKLLIHGLRLSKKVGWYKDVYESVLNKSIDINTLGIKIYDYEKKRNVSDYSLIVIEVYNPVADTHRYRFMKKFVKYWEITDWVSDYEFNSLIDRSYKVDEYTVNRIIDKVVEASSNQNPYYGFDIWYIPDLSHINIPEDKNYKEREEIQRLRGEYYKLKKDIAEESRKHNERITEMLNKSNDILKDILKCIHEIENIKEDEKEESFEETLEKQLNVYDTDDSFDIYRIFDKVRPMIYSCQLLRKCFTEEDKYFYKYIEAGHRAGKFNKLYPILSEGLYHIPKCVQINDTLDLESYDSIILIPKRKVSRYGKTISAIYIMPYNDRSIFVDFYDRTSFIERTYYHNDKPVHNFLKDYPESAHCDIYKFKYKDLPTEKEMIDNLVEIKNCLN